MTAALKPVARDLLAWLQGRPAAGEGSLKSWGQGRRPSLTLTQVEVRAAELVDTGLVTREVRPDGRSVYRARERSPEPPPVEVVTTPEPSPTPLPASVKKVRKAPPVAPAATPPPCAECTRLAEALLSWERLWGRDGTGLAAMEERIQIAERERDDARAAHARDLIAARARIEQLAAQVTQATSPSPPAPSAAYGVQLALDALSTSRGTSRREVATRAGISLHSAGKALAALAAEGLAYESTPGLWRRR
jgi:hypothetical protein